MKFERQRRTRGRPVRDYPCTWTGSGFAGLEEFGRRVLDVRRAAVNDEALAIALPET